VTSVTIIVSEPTRKPTIGPPIIPEKRHKKPIGLTFGRGARITLEATAVAVRIDMSAIFRTLSFILDG